MSLRRPRARSLESAKESKRILTREEMHHGAMLRGARCPECPMYGCGRGPVLGLVRPDAKLVVLGEAPGPDEVDTGEPFVGRSGLELDVSIGEAGVSRKDCAVTNTILCQPEGSFESYMADLQRPGSAFRNKLLPPEACWPRLERDLRDSGLSPTARSTTKTALAVGNQALASFARFYDVPFDPNEDHEGPHLYRIMTQAGSPVVMPSGDVVASALHPAYAMREHKEYTGFIRKTITRAASIATRGIEYVEPEYIYFQKFHDPYELLCAIESICAEFIERREEERVKVDIECDDIAIHKAKIRCVGMGMLRDNAPLIVSVPFRWMNGQRFWASRAWERRAFVAVREVLEQCKLTFHNGLFDTAVLLENGFMSDRKKPWLDTMLMTKNSPLGDLPKSLGFLVRYFTPAALWKKDIDHKGGGGTTDQEYHLYNCRDVYNTALIEEPLVELVQSHDDVASLTCDTKLAPIARDMGRLGLFIDEKVRGELSLAYREVVEAAKLKVQKCAKREDFNPGSPAQVADWLYNVQGLRPPVNTDGYEWKLGDKAAAGVPTMLKLLDLGVSQEVEEFIEAYIGYKAADKVRGTYIDNLKVQYTWKDPPWDVLEDCGAPEVRSADMPRLKAVEYLGKMLLPERPEISWLPVTWKIHIVPSGRAVANPNVQNWPARAWAVNGKPIKPRKMIVAPPGHVIVGMDYEQVELRIYGVVANDQYVLKAFRDNLEPHCLNAATIFAAKEDEIMALYELFFQRHKHGTPEQQAEMKYTRTVAKRVCYLMNYGGEEEKLHSAMVAERDKATGERPFRGLPRARVQEWEERWRKRHPETKVWHRRVGQDLYRNGYVESPVLTHRKRHMPFGANKKNAPPNHEIQAAASDFKNEAILRLAEAIPFGKWSRWTGLCLDIHDYLAVFVPEEKAEEAIEIFNRCTRFEMECADGWKMPIYGEAKASKNLADNA